MLGVFRLAVVVLTVAWPGTAVSATFTLQCAVEGEAADYVFLFDTRKGEVLARRPGQGATLAKYQKIEITHSKVTFARFSLMGSASRKYRVSRSGGTLEESRKRGSWSDWKSVGRCWQP